MNPFRATSIVCVMMAFLPASQDAAQESVDLRQETRAGDLDAPVEEGVADVSALGTSLRLIDPGLVTPMDFGDVYRVPGMPAMLMRIAGGVYAVFPQSVYSEQGALIPPGTTFYIGAPPEMLPDGMRLPMLLPDGSEPAEIELLAPPAPVEISASDLVAGWTRGGATTIANNLVYRRERIRELMLEAAANDGAAAGIGESD